MADTAGVALEVVPIQRDMVAQSPVQPRVGVRGESGRRLGEGGQEILCDVPCTVAAEHISISAQFFVVNAMDAVSCLRLGDDPREHAGKLGPATSGAGGERVRFDGSHHGQKSS